MVREKPTAKEIFDILKEKVSKDVFLIERTLDEALKVISLNIYHAIKKEKEPVPFKGIIFYGFPGTGKTYLMNKLEEILIEKETERLLGLRSEDFRVVKIAGPEIVSEYYGKTERNIRNRFREAEEIAEASGIGIIYIDEIDSITPRRESIKGDLEPRLVGQLLTLMDGLKKNNVFVVASTNRISAIDPALRRPGRFDYEIEFELPDKELRKKLFNYYLNKYIETFQEINEEILEKTDGYSPADIMHFAREVYKSLTFDEEIDFNELFQNILMKIIPTGLRNFKILKREYFKDSIPEEVFQKDLLKIHSEEIAKRYISFLLKEEKVNEVISVNCIRFLSKFSGETENNIMDFFEKIRHFRNRVIWFRKVKFLKEYYESYFNLIIQEIEDLKEMGFYIVLSE